ncbi:MAG TPA: ABC transporter ATP-binding protein/permease [Rhodopila sp.]|uniref:ABC transporter ATP-binding protein/permease n=1 Tax=Rhodopila sp. TaxID=2480087 RepID=UPI002CB92BA1|nr:ABC transporter ATP-binding protein/permease [Rhodopila sp.]HVY14082.1 ABC transporter ATP-binding protein/permease [Rhodopila sp.]
MRGIGPFLKDAWQLTRPYFASSEERWSARGILAAIVAMNLMLVGLSVVLSFWRREFYNALQDKDWKAFMELLFVYRHTPSGFMPGFCEVAAIFILLSVYSVYLNQLLQIRWRRWLTRQFLHEWLADRAYYNISLTADREAVGTDNPDQRISEDLRDFTRMALTLSLDLLSNIVSLFSFIGILWGLSGAVEAFGIPIPGYMVWVALAYALVGTTLTHLVGRPLTILNFRQQRVEADFRYALVRIRENMEGIALHRGEQEEIVTLRQRFAEVIANWWQIMNRTKLLNTLTNGYAQVAVIFPVVVAAPRYFAGSMQLGGLMQTVGAFGSVQSSMSWFVDSYAQLAQWRAIVERLATFHRAIVKARAENHGGFQASVSPDGTLRLIDVTMTLPDGTKLLEGADLMLTPGHSVVITGRTGSGKSTLFRVMAGIWPFGHGTVEIPENSFFLPQRPYIPLGSLRHVITYPHAVEAFTHEEIVQALVDAGLPKLCERVGDDDNWPMRLSGGEQQRIAVARALLAKPDWIFLDEATASLDPKAEEDVYRILRTRLPNATLVSIAHRPSVAAFHDERLVFQRDEGKTGTLVTSTPVPAAGE